MEELTVILAPDCHECDEVKAYVEKRELGVSIVELTIEEMEKLDLFVFPTLRKGNSILAYGTDIIDYIENNYNN